MNIKTKLALTTASIATFMQPFVASAADGIKLTNQAQILTNSWKVYNLPQFIAVLLQVVFAIAGLLVFIFLVWGGIQWLTSGGDSGATQKARDRITAALVGLAIIALAWAIVNLVGPWLGWDNPLNVQLGKIRNS